tara:strand:- start:8310 stop:8561 length:252 start_codon:yes stop_codon:yes gene_type:complete
MIKHTVPIWLADFTLSNKEGRKFYAKRIVCKGNDETELMNNPEVLYRCKRTVRGGNKLLNSLTIESVRLISQHGYGIKEFDYV